MIKPWRPFIRSVGILDSEGIRLNPTGRETDRTDVYRNISNNCLPKLLDLRVDGERQQFEDPGDTHYQHQFDVEQTLESQNSQLAARVIAILMPQTPASQSEIDYV